MSVQYAGGSCQILQPSIRTGTDEYFIYFHSFQFGQRFDVIYVRMGRNIRYHIFSFIRQHFFVLCIVIKMEPRYVVIIYVAVSTTFFCRCEQSDFGTTFDGHIGNSQPFVNGHGIDGRATEFQGFIGAAGSFQISQDAQGDVFGADSVRQCAVYLDFNG